jgi:hypothetical protein
MAVRTVAVVQYRVQGGISKNHCSRGNWPISPNPPSPPSMAAMMIWWKVRRERKCVLTLERRYGTEEGRVRWFAPCLPSREISRDSHVGALCEVGRHDLYCSRSISQSSAHVIAVCGSYPRRWPFCNTKGFMAGPPDLISVRIKPSICKGLVHRDLDLEPFPHT